jgi:hypothetical protein
MEKLIKLVESFLDWFNVFFSRVKGLGYLIAVVVFALFVFNNGCKQRQAEQLIEKITGLNIRNDLLLEDNKRIEAELQQKELLLQQKNFQIDSVNKLKLQAENKAKYWRNKHDKISEDLMKITADSSYMFLQSVFNFPGILKYGFNEPQVKSIHRVYLENENKMEQLQAKDIALWECDKENQLLKESNQIREEKYELKTGQYENASKVISNKDEENELLKKQLKKEKRRGILKTIGIGVGFLIGLLI